MSHDEFTQLYLFFQDFRSEMQDEFKNVYARFDLVDKRFDAQEARMDKISSELTALISQVDRHDRRIHALADKTETQLEY